MEEKNRLDNFVELVSKKPSNFLDKFNNLKANKKSLDRAAEIAISILDILKEKGWSQKHLAAKMGVTPQYVSKLVKGRENLTFETIDRLEDVLGCTLLSVLDQSKSLTQCVVYPKSTIIGDFNLKEKINTGNKSTIKSFTPVMKVVHNKSEKINYDNLLNNEGYINNEDLLEM